MVADELNPKIFEYLKKKLNGKIAESTIRPAISRIRGKYLSLTPNAAAEVFANQHDLTVHRFLNDRDREAFKTIKIEKVKIKTHSPRTRVKIQEIASYETANKLLKANIDEINKTYTFGCYTASFILCRKVLENLLIHQIFQKKYPTQSQEDRSKYFDFSKGRPLDFSVLLSNLKKSATDFPDKKLVERICNLADRFKEEANDMTHSIYHIASKRELDEKNYQQILDLISELEKSIE